MHKKQSTEFDLDLDREPNALDALDSIGEEIALYASYAMPRLKAMDKLVDAVAVASAKRGKLRKPKK